MAGDQQATLFFCVRQGWVLLRRRRTRKGVLSTFHTVFNYNSLLVLLLFFLLTWIFWVGWGEQFKTSRTQKRHREITSLVLFEWLQGLWLQGLWQSVPSSGWSHLVSFFWILGIGKHQSIAQTITSTLKQMTVTLRMPTFKKEYFNRQMIPDCALFTPSRQPAQLIPK